MEEINLKPEKGFACWDCPNAIWQEGKIGLSSKDEIVFLSCYCQKLHKDTYKRHSHEEPKAIYFYTKCQAKDDFLREVIDGSI
jgi:hypothetical protein